MWGDKYERRACVRTNVGDSLSENSVGTEKKTGDVHIR
jgi:hypothetical protein